MTDSEGRVANYPGRIVVAREARGSRRSLLRPGKVGKLYGARLKTLGGVKPATWRILRGPLPRGVRFDRTTGTLLGTPKKAGQLPRDLRGHGRARREVDEDAPHPRRAGSEAQEAVGSG